ncbi:MAG: thioredoxin family protein [Ruminococcaceae bacterium]|nr:thioredoxin family protein [Oscillospiraceae bacterium]
MEKLTAENFREKVYFSDKRRAVLFTAPWCGFCRSMKLMCEKAQKDISSVEFYTVDIDAEPELKKAFAVAAVPTFIVFEDGKPLNKATGLMKKSELYTLLGAETRA